MNQCATRSVLTLTTAIFVACGPATPRPHGENTVASNASSSPPPGSRAENISHAGDASLEDLRARMAAGDAASLGVLGVALAASEGARDITGDVAPDEGVERAVVVNHVGDDASMLVVTTCGNATLASVHFESSRWRTVTRVPVMQDLRPGRCGQTSVRAEPLRLSSDAAREVAVVMVSQDATGASVTGPYLSAYQLTRGGRLETLLANAPFGAMDDETGAITHGEFLVVDDVPAPRDLHVSISPGRRGPGGAPVAEIVRRTSGLRHGRLELIDEHSEESD